MASRKIYCEVVEGVTYDDRYLFRLSKVLAGNKICEGCVLRQLEILRRCGAREPKDRPQDRPPEKASAGPKKKTKAKKIPKGIKATKATKVTKDTSHMRDMQYIDVLSLAKLLGKSPRRIQELAKEGKIPARKVGPVWQFNKQEIDQWLSVKGIPPLQCGHNVDISTGPSQGEDVASRDQQEEGSAIKGVPGAGKKKATAPNV